MTTSKKNILVVLTTKEYMNNYLYTKALLDIEQKNSVTVLIPETLSEFVPKSDTSAIVSLPDSVFDLSEGNFRLITDMYRKRFRKKSKSFSYRDKRIDSIMWSYANAEFNRSILRLREKTKNYVVIILDMLKNKNSDTCWSKLRIIHLESRNYAFSLIRFTKSQLGIAKRISRGLFKKFILKIFTLRIIFEVAQFILSRRVKTPNLLQNFLKLHNFDLVILPSAAFEPTVIHLAKLKTELGFKFLLLTDNWDNLSSKTVLWLRPDAITTWGEQSTKHAIDIQGFSREKVHEIGTARFSNHVMNRNTVPISSVSANYVLFVGTFLKFNEYECLRILDEEISANREVYGDLKIMYRPHPFTPPDDSLDAKRLDSVIMDESIEKYRNNSGMIAIDFEETLKIQINSRFVIGGLTSMLIEASILGKNFLALVHKEEKNFTSPHIVRSSYEHFVGIEALPNVTFLEELDLLPSQFREVFLKKNLKQEEIDLELSYFYDLRPLTYSKKLGALLDQILI